MRERICRLSQKLAFLSLLCAAVAGLAGCASSGNPNETRYRFPGDPEATPAPAPAVATASPAAAPTPTPPPTLAAPSDAASVPAPAPADSDQAPTSAPTKAPMTSSKLRVGDMVTISFSDVPAPGLQFIQARIPDDGMLTLHYSVRVKAAGLTIPEVERDIRAAYVPRLFRNLTAIVRTDERGDFYVGGEVKMPNRFPLRGDMTVLRAIDSAGGFTEFANHNKIELRRQDGTRVWLSEKKVSDGKAVDLPVMPNDHITVKRRIF